MCSELRKKRGFENDSATKSWDNARARRPEPVFVQSTLEKQSLGGCRNLVIFATPTEEDSEPHKIGVAEWEQQG